MDYRLVFNGNLSQPSANALRARVAEVMGQDDLEDLTILFSSDGGSTREGLALHHFFRALPHPVRMYAAGHVGSAAVSVFMGAHRRGCAPTARFFFHSFRWSFSDGPQAMEQIAEANLRVAHDAHLARLIVERYANVPAKRLGTLYGEGAVPTIVEPEQALEWGLVDEIYEINPEGRKQANTKVVTVGW